MDEHRQLEIKSAFEDLLANWAKQLFATTPIDRDTVTWAVEKYYELAGKTKPKFLILGSPWQMLLATTVLEDCLPKSIDTPPPRPFTLESYHQNTLIKCQTVIQQALSPEDKHFLSGLLSHYAYRFEQPHRLAINARALVTHSDIPNDFQVDLNDRLQHEYATSTVLSEVWASWYVGVTGHTDWFANFQGRRTFQPEFCRWRFWWQLLHVRFCRDYFNIQFGEELARQFEVMYKFVEANHACLCFNEVCIVSDFPSSIKVDDMMRYHCSDGPSLTYGDGLECHAWHGTVVPKRIIEQGQTVTVDAIDAEPNAELKRVMISMYGEERYLIDSGAKLVDESAYGCLYRKKFHRSEDLVMVRVVNRTPEPDGSYRHYFLRVPPFVDTAKRAVAWTFNISNYDYGPLVET